MGERKTEKCSRIPKEPKTHYFPQKKRKASTNHHASDHQSGRGGGRKTSNDKAKSHRNESGGKGTSGNHRAQVHPYPY